jgi:tetratricopeptide (TPR) repeat protein
LLERCIALWAPDTFADRQDAAREALELAETVSDPVLEFRAVENELAASLERGDRDGYDRCQALVDHLAAELREPSLVWTARSDQTMGALLSGDAQDAERIATEALDLGMATGQPDAFEFYGGQLLEIRRAQGRLDEMVDLLAQLVEEDPNIPAFRAALTNAYCFLGQEDNARRLVEGDVIEAYATAPRDSTWTSAMALYAESAAKLGLIGPAKVLYATLLPFREQVAFTGITVYGSLSHYLALLAATLGENDSAAEHFVDAMKAHEQLRSPYFRAVTELAWAEFLLAHDRTGERGHASAMIDHARATAREYGFAAIELAGRQLAGRFPKP